MGHDRDEGAGDRTVRRIAPAHVSPTESFGFAAAVGAVVTAICWWLTPDRTLRLLFIGLLVPLGAFGGLVARLRWPRLQQAWTTWRSARRARSRDLQEDAKGEVVTSCVGRLRAKDFVVAPRSSARCAAYVLREPLRPSGSEVVTEVADAQLETKKHGLVQLGPGPWNVVDPFDSSVLDGEARLDEGAEVVVTSRVTAVVAPTEGYRGSSVSYRLMAHGGTIAPRKMAFSSELVHHNSPRFLIPAWVSLAYFAGAAVFLLFPHKPKDLPGRAVPAAEGTASAIATTLPACGENWSCPDKSVCDVETRQCVRSLEGKLEAGAACTAAGQCAKGLRCRPDLANAKSSGRVCTYACRSDNSCPTGSWCVPCQNEALTQDGDCVSKGSLEGALKTVCDMVHETKPPDTDDDDINLPPR